MNFKKGLFRLWVVGSAVFAIGTGFLGWQELEINVIRERQALGEEAERALTVPIDCKLVRGEQGKDYTRRTHELTSELMGEKFSDTCWYRLAALRRLFPEYNDINDAALSFKLYELNKAPPIIHPSDSPLDIIIAFTLIGLGVPGAALALGSALYWALSGFRMTKRRAE